MEEAARNGYVGGSLVRNGVLRVAHQLAGAPEILGVTRVCPRYGPVQRLCQGTVGPLQSRGGQDGVGRKHVHLHGLLRQPAECGLERQLLERAEIYGGACAQGDRNEDRGEDAGQEQPVFGNVFCYETELAGLVHQ